jgi:hypothetical protein
MERFSQLLWAILISCHFSLFVNFTPLFISLIYSVFFNKAVQDFDNPSIMKGNLSPSKCQGIQSPPLGTQEWMITGAWSMGVYFMLLLSSDLACPLLFISPEGDIWLAHHQYFWNTIRFCVWKPQIIFTVAVIWNHMVRIGKEFKVPKKCTGGRVGKKTPWNMFGHSPT